MEIYNILHGSSGRVKQGVNYMIFIKYLEKNHKSSLDVKFSKNNMENNTKYGAFIKLAIIEFLSYDYIFIKQILGFRICFIFYFLIYVLLL